MSFDSEKSKLYLSDRDDIDGAKPVRVKDSGEWHDIFAGGLTSAIMIGACLSSLMAGSTVCNSCLLVIVFGRKKQKQKHTHKQVRSFC
jgi:hypothetical protein